MSLPKLSPYSTTNAIVLTATGSIETSGNGAGNSSHYPFGMYAEPESNLYDINFVNGASDQVAYTYKKLGGDILDIELTPGNIYASYEEAVLEYSYQVNIHQAKNVLSDLLGMSTGTFDHDGQMTGGDAEGTAVNLKFPRFEFGYAQRVAEGLAQEAGIGGNLTMYSGSFALTGGRQDYDLQSLISASSDNGIEPATGNAADYAGKIKNNKIKIHRVFYKTPEAIWRFYGYYGGLNVVGNLNHYGQYADDTTFELIPAWHNKLQAMAYEDHMYTRLSHYSYEIRNNKLRIFPLPDGNDTGEHMWVEFTVGKNAWEEDPDRQDGVDGINNVNTLPFENVPYKNINAIGKQWIRRYALALSKETLSHVRGKFGSIPIPGEAVTLNASQLSTESATEQEKLKTEIKEIFDQMTYRALMEDDAKMVTAVGTIQEEIPLLIYQG